MSLVIVVIGVAFVVMAIGRLREAEALAALADEAPSHLRPQLGRLALVGKLAAGVLTLLGALLLLVELLDPAPSLGRGVAIAAVSAVVALGIAPFALLQRHAKHDAELVAFLRERRR